MYMVCLSGSEFVQVMLSFCLSVLLLEIQLSTGVWDPINKFNPATPPLCLSQARTWVSTSYVQVVGFFLCSVICGER